jgi:hypothetical protein
MFRERVCALYGLESSRCGEEQRLRCNEFKSTYKLSEDSKKVFPKYSAVEYRLNGNIELTAPTFQEDVIWLTHLLKHPVICKSLMRTNQYVGSIFDY